jgi:hypothetical protein
MKFREWLVLENAGVTVPEDPGTTPVPPGHVRLYHYTKISNPEAAEALRQNGLDISQARGSTYGEPNVVWASSRTPERSKVFAEFSISADDPRWAEGKPEPGSDPREYERRGWDCYFRDSIRPDEIIAVHEPWHWQYRYLKKNPGLWDELESGEFDRLLNDAEYGPAVRQAKLDLAKWRADAGLPNQPSPNGGAT